MTDRDPDVSVPVPVGQPTPLIGLLATGEKSTRNFSCEKSPDLQAIVHSPNGKVEILSQTATEITIVNRSGHLATYMVLCIPQRFVRGLVALADAYRNLRPTPRR